MDEKIKRLAGRYLRKEIQLQDFQQQFAGFYFQVRKARGANLPASKLCDEIVGPRAELSRGHRSDISFREELENAVCLFAEVLHGPRTVLGFSGSSTKLVDKPKQMVEFSVRWKNPLIPLSGVFQFAAGSREILSPETS